MLDLVLQPALLVLRNLSAFLSSPEDLDTVTAHVTDRDAGLLGIFRRDARELAAPLFVEIRDRHPNHLTFGLGIKPQPRLPDRLVDRLYHCAVTYLNRDHPGLRDANIGELVDRHGAAIGGNSDRLEQARRSTTGSQSSKFLAQHLDRAIHSA